MTAQPISPTDRTRAWLPLRRSQDAVTAPAVLFCLPHAGGSASAFRGWVGAIEGVEVLPVQLPGREARLKEACLSTMEAVVAAVGDVVLDAAAGRPFALYGHSLGSLTAFEVTRALRRRGGPLPAHLVVSGSAAPQKSGSFGRKVSTLPTPRLVEALRAMGGTPDWLLADPELQAMILPPVRADFAVREHYRYRAEAPLDLPITVVASHDDPRASHRLQAKWAAQTSRDFVLHTLTGGHFAVLEQTGTTIAHLADALRRSGLLR